MGVRPIKRLTSLAMAGTEDTTGAAVASTGMHKLRLRAVLLGAVTLMVCERRWAEPLGAAAATACEQHGVHRSDSALPFALCWLQVPVHNSKLACKWSWALLLSLVNDCTSTGVQHKTTHRLCVPRAQARSGCRSGWRSEGSHCDLHD
jgi:hypothetical protein